MRKAKHLKMNYLRMFHSLFYMSAALKDAKSLTTFQSSRACFVKCDTRSWDDQVRMFEAAISNSPQQSVDVVIANAGVGRGSGDPMMALEGWIDLSP